MFQIVFQIDSSVTDWIQAATGVLGAAGLIWTLNLQRKAMVLQADGIKIEEDRDRRALLPIFEITDVPTNANTPFLGYFKFTLQRGDAYDVLLGPIKNKNIDIGTFTTVEHWQPGEEHEFPYRWMSKGSLSRDSRIGPSTAVIGKMYFHDEGRRPYSQIIYTNGNNVFSSLATLITDEERSAVMMNFHDFK